MSDKSNAEGIQKSAILLLSLGEVVSAQVFKMLDPREVGLIGQEMMKLESIPQEEVEEVLVEFNEAASEAGMRGLPRDQIKQLIRDAVGEDGSLMVPGESTKGIDNLRWLDSKTIADFIQNEHPQIIALILSFLESQKAADVLTSISDNNLRTEVIQRISKLEDIHPSALIELSQNLERQLEGNKSSTTSKVGGLQLAADMLNFLGGTVEQELMDNLNEKDAKLAEQIQELMFVFDDLVDVDTKAIQTILKDVKPDRLALALKAADEKVKDKIFGNMSKRAAEMLQDDLESMGPVKISDAETAQKEILSTARKLAEEGKIMLSMKGDDALV